MTENPQAASKKRDTGGIAAHNISPALEPWLVRLLACPVDRGAVKLNGRELVCTRCGRRYPVRNGIPLMVPDLEESEQ